MAAVAAAIVLLLLATAGATPGSSSASLQDVDMVAQLRLQVKIVSVSDDPASTFNPDALSSLVRTVVSAMPTTNVHDPVVEQRFPQHLPSHSPRCRVVPLRRRV